MGDKRTCPSCGKGKNRFEVTGNGKWYLVIFAYDDSSGIAIQGVVYHCPWCGHKLSESVQKKENKSHVDVVSEVISSLGIQCSNYEVGTEIRHAYNDALDRLRVLESKILNSNKNRVLMDVEPVDPENIDPITKWEYKVLRERSICDFVDWLDVVRSLGNKGWELITVSKGVEITRWVFKRQKS